METGIIIKDILAFIPQLRRYAKSLSPTDAEDMVQITLERAILNLDSFDGANLHAWLLTILKNTIMYEFRRLKTLKINQEVYFRSISHYASDNPEAALIAKEIINQLSTLSDTQQEAILAIAVHDLKYHQIAKLQNVEQGTVKSRLARGREKLRKFTE